MEEIKQSVRYGSESICPSCVHNGVCRAIDNQPCVECDHYFVQDEWISVKDRMPRLFHSVLVSDGENVGVGEYCGTTNLGFVHWSCDIDRAMITHWKELPGPPTED